MIGTGDGRINALVEPITSRLTDHFDLGNWSYGLAAAFIAGFANSASGVIAVMFVAPEQFNLTNPWPLLQVGLAAGIIGGVLGFFGVLKNTPLPARIEVKTATTTTTKVSKPEPDVEVKDVVKVVTTEVTKDNTGD